MFKNMRLVILFDMFLNPSFKMTTSFANIARTTAGSRTAATSKMERLVITIITKRSILDVAAVLDPPLRTTASTSKFIY